MFRRLEEVNFTKFYSYFIFIWLSSLKLALLDIDKDQFFNNLHNFSGTALGAVIPPFVVDSNVSNEKIGQDLRLLLICYSVVAGVTLVLICTRKYYSVQPRERHNLHY